MNVNLNAVAVHASVRFSFYLAATSLSHTRTHTHTKDELIPYHEDELSVRHSYMITILPTQVEEQTNTRL